MQIDIDVFKPQTLNRWVSGVASHLSCGDTNHNAKTDAGELKTFAELGITAISLSSTSQSGEVRDGNEVLARSTFTKNGTTQEAISANFVANLFGNLSATLANGILVTKQGNANTGTSKTYVSTAQAGEVINLDTLDTANANHKVDNAQGGTGNDTLNGNSLNNWLAGGRGSDTFNAGAGNDVLVIDSEDLQQNIHAGSGDDAVAGRDGTDTVRNVERLQFKGLNIAANSVGPSAVKNTLKSVHLYY